MLWQIVPFSLLIGTRAHCAIWTSKRAFEGMCWSVSTTFLDHHQRQAYLGQRLQISYLSVVCVFTNLHQKQRIPFHKTGFRIRGWQCQLDIPPCRLLTLLTSLLALACASNPSLDLSSLPSSFSSSSLPSSLPLSSSSSSLSSSPHSPIHTISLGPPTRERGRSYGGRLLKHLFKVTPLITAVPFGWDLRPSLLLVVHQMDLKSRLLLLLLLVLHQMELGIFKFFLLLRAASRFHHFERRTLQAVQNSKLVVYRCCTCGRTGRCKM